MAHYLRANSKHSQSDSFGMKSLFLAQKEAPYQSLLCQPPAYLADLPMRSISEKAAPAHLCQLQADTLHSLLRTSEQPLQSWLHPLKVCLLQKLTSHLTEKVKHSTYVTARLSHNPHTDGITKINLCLFATCHKNSLIALTYWNNHCIFPLNIAS